MREITNHKHQIPNNTQWPKFKFLNELTVCDFEFGILNLFETWKLEFGISRITLCVMRAFDLHALSTPPAFILS